MEIIWDNMWFVFYFVPGQVLDTPFQWHAGQSMFWFFLSPRVMSNFWLSGDFRTHNSARPSYWSNYQYIKKNCWKKAEKKCFQSHAQLINYCCPWRDKSNKKPKKYAVLNTCFNHCWQQFFSLLTTNYWNNTKFPEKIAQIS